MDKKINSKAYRLVAPGKFEEVELEHDFGENEIVVEPIMASVCHADLRYYTGNRRQEALESKLPMALFHEGIGIVRESKHPNVKEGEKVVIVPNIPTRYQLHLEEEVPETELMDNYDENAKFMGSGYDGISQDKMVLHGDNIVKVPEGLKDDLALLAELCSVSLFPMNQIEYLTTDESPYAAVFGDGPVGYLAAAAMHYIHGIDKEHLIVFGADESKLSEFTHFATPHIVFDYDFKNAKGVHTVFECTGGRFSESAINQAIDLIDRQGNIVLMGVTEESVGINTRDILEKGLTLSGSSRSTKYEFEQLIDQFSNPEYEATLRKLIPEEFYEINSIKDLNRAMDDAAAHKGWKKTYLKYNWQN